VVWIEGVLVLEDKLEDVEKAGLNGLMEMVIMLLEPPQA
jgi:hypothetical protein